MKLISPLWETSCGARFRSVSKSGRRAGTKLRNGPNTSHEITMQDASRQIAVEIRAVNLTDEELAKFHSRMIIKGPSECWPWIAGHTPGGYGTMRIGGVNRRAARIAFAISRGSVPADRMVCHACDNPPCCNPAHLFLGVQRENMRDCVKKDRIATGVRHGSATHPEAVLRGEGQPNAKLSDSDVLTMRELRRGGMKQVRIAELFAVSQQTVSRILLRKRWRHL